MFKILALSFLFAAAVSPSTTQDQSFSSALEINTAANIVTVKGKISELTKIHHPYGRGYGIQLNILADTNEVVTVILGPSWYLEKMNFPVQEGDLVEVEGEETKDVIIAYKIKIGPNKLTLRDKDGKSKWSGALWQ